MSISLTFLGLSLELLSAEHPKVVLEAGDYEVDSEGDVGCLHVAVPCLL